MTYIPMVDAGKEYIMGFGPVDSCDACENAGDDVCGYDIRGKEVGERNGAEGCCGVDASIGEVDGVLDGCF